MKNGDNPYTETGQYTGALVFNPDIVTIMLGTNDSKESNWQYKDEFVPDLLSLISDFRELDSKPTVILATPAFVERNNYGITEEIVGVKLPACLQFTFPIPPEE